jgi:hypothetical protein
MDCKNTTASTQNHKLNISPGMKLDFSKLNGHKNEPVDTRSLTLDSIPDSADEFGNKMFGDSKHAQNDLSL